MGAILNDLNQIIRQKDKVVSTVALDLYNELVNATPVQTGYLRGGWELKEFQDGTIIIDNPVEYAEIRLLPLITDDNGSIIQGSKQFSAGIEGILDKYERILQQKLKAIK